MVWPSDAQNFVERYWILNSLGPDLHLLADFEIGAHLSPGGVGNQDLTSSRIRLYARGEIHVTADNAILHTFGRADIAHHHRAGVNPDAHFYFGQILLPVLFVDDVHGELHRDRASDRALRVILLPHGNAEEHKDRIADDLINSALILVDDGDHGRQIAIDK